MAGSSTSSSCELLAKRSRRSRRFTPLTRQLCLQHHACGFGYKKISKATGIPISTIKYHVRKEHCGVATSCGDEGDNEDGQEESRAVDDADRSIAFVAVMQAVHDAVKKNVYAFARALQHDPHGAPGIMRAADPQLLVSALELLLQDPWTERQELATLGRILLQRLYSAQDFLRSAISLCQRTPSASNSVGASLVTDSPPMPPKAASSDAKYWDCPVCARRLIRTGKCAHQARCLKKCKIVLTSEQLQVARAKVAATAKLSGSPEELKLQLKQALSPPRGDDKCHGQVRYMQLVVAVNAALQQDLEAVPESILESRELWRAAQSAPNPMVPALALVSLALEHSSSVSRSDASTAARLLQLSRELAAQVSAFIAAAEAVLARCAEAAAACDDDPHHAQHTCSCHRVRISALLS